MRYSPAYYDCGKLQVVLFQAASDSKTPVKDLAQCVRAWIDLEKLKREIRGIPPLAPAKLAELFDHLKRTRRPREIGSVIVDVPPVEA